MKKLTVTLTQGLQGSGKSTWAKQQVGLGKTVRIDNDSLRMMFDNTYWQNSPKVRKVTEPFMIKARDNLILLGVTEGKNVVVDAMHLSPRHLVHITDLVKDFSNVEVKIKSFLDVPIEECIKRDLKRDKSVGEAVIRQTYKDYLKANGLNFKTYPIQYDSTLPDCIICDIDGTLANNDWRDPFNTTKCDKDGAYENIINLLSQYWIDDESDRPQIILMSGREDSCMLQTKKWLADFQVLYDSLLMRKTDDHRKDSIVKKEIYEDNIQGKFNVRFVLDDRDQVVEMWRELGLTCLQVAAGDF